MTARLTATRSLLRLPSLSDALRKVVEASWSFRPESVTQAVRDESRQCLSALGDLGLAHVDRAELGRHLKKLFTVFWDRRPEQHWSALMDAYASVVEHFPAEVLVAGIEHTIRHSTFLPKPADVLTACYDAMPSDYRAAYRLRERLRAILKAPVAASAPEPSLEQIQRLRKVIQSFSSAKRLGE
jgi:hypothetical protein